MNPKAPNNPSKQPKPSINDDKSRELDQDGQKQQWGSNEEIPDTDFPGKSGEFRDPHKPLPEVYADLRNGS